MAREIWLGVVRVRAVPGKNPFPPGSTGANVHAMAYVESADEFKKMVSHELRSLGLLTERIDGLDLLENQIEGTEPTAELFNTMEELMETGGVRFDEFEPF